MIFYRILYDIIVISYMIWHSYLDLKLLTCDKTSLTCLWRYLNGWLSRWKVKHMADNICCPKRYSGGWRFSHTFAHHDSLLRVNPYGSEAPGDSCQDPRVLACPFIVPVNDPTKNEHAQPLNRQYSNLTKWSKMSQALLSSWKLSPSSSLSQTHNQ